MVNMRGRSWLEQRGQIFLILTLALVDSNGRVTTLFLKPTHVHINRAKDLLNTSRSCETYRASFFYRKTALCTSFGSVDHES